MKKLIPIIMMLLLTGCEEMCDLFTGSATAQAPLICKTCIRITTVFNVADTTTYISKPFDLCGERLKMTDNLVTRITSEDEAENTLVSVTICDYAE
jgi:hypothetical protein